MLPATLTFITLALGSSFRRNRPWLLFALGWLTIMIAFRDLSVGTDSNSYYNMYYWAGTNGYKGYPEPLYGYLEVLFYKLGLSFWEFQFILFAFAFTLMYKVIIRWSPNPSFSIFAYFGLYFAMYAMNATRQMIAVSIILYAYGCLAGGGWKKFCFWILIASGFHTSSLLALLVLFIKKLKIRSFKFVLITSFISLFIGFMLPVSALLFLSGDYSHYLQDVDGNGLRTTYRLQQAFALSFFWTTLYMICISNIKESLINNFWLKLYYIGMIANNICMKAEQGLRIVWIFSIAEIIAFPMIIANSTTRSKMLMWVIITLYLTIFFFTLLITNSADVWPYKNILF